MGATISIENYVPRQSMNIKAYREAYESAKARDEAAWGVGYGDHHYWEWHGEQAALESDSFELHLSYSTIGLLLRNLGIDADCENDALDARVLLEAIDARRPSVVDAYAPHSVGGDGCATLINCGKSASTIDVYVDRLRAIAMEALEIGQRVTWA